MAKQIGRLKKDKDTDENELPKEEMNLLVIAVASTREHAKGLLEKKAILLGHGTSEDEYMDIHSSSVQSP